MSSKHGIAITGSEAADSSASKKKCAKVKLGTHPKRQILTTKLSKLEDQLSQLNQVYRQLTHEHTLLQRREKVLFTKVQEQGEYLHNVAAVCIARQPEGGTGSSSHNLAGSSAAMMDAAAALAETAMTDLRVMQALEQVGCGPARSCHSPELRTTACLRAALTEQGIHWARHVTLPEFLQLHRERVMRLSFLLTHPTKADMLTGSIESIVMDIVATHTLLFAAADKFCLQLLLVNCDTGQQEPIPPGHFQHAAESLKLKPAQAHHLRTGFQVYQTRRCALLTKVHGLAQQISELTSRDMHTLQAPQASAAAGPSQGMFSVKSELPCNPERKPWQQLGLAHCGGLTLEDADQLQQLLLAYDHHVWQCRLLGRTLSWLLINTLSIQQLAEGLLACYPFYPQAVAICAAVR